MECRDADFCVMHWNEAFSHYDPIYNPENMEPWTASHNVKHRLEMWMKDAAICQAYIHGDLHEHQAVAKQLLHVTHSGGAPTGVMEGRPGPEYSLRFKAMELGG